MRGHSEQQGIFDDRLQRARRKQAASASRKKSKRQDAFTSDQLRQAPKIRGRRQYASRTGRNVAAAALGLALMFFSGYLIFQLYHIQVASHAAYAKLAADQHYKKVAELPKRGQILDRNGIELAGTTYVYRIGITPKDVRSVTKNISSEEIAQAISGCLDLELAEVRQAMSETDQLYIQLKKDTSRAQTDALRDYLREADIGGVRIDAEPQRYYTNGQLASQVIGFTRYGEDNLVGQLGVELQYNDLLTGQPGYTYVETDNYGGRGELPFSAPTSLRAQDGQSIMLNLDVNIQKIVQEELEKTIKMYDISQGGTAIVMDPYTGAILAMADYPYFSSDDPTARPPSYAGNTWDDTDPATIEYLSAAVWRNRAISDGYRPGSTMKTLTAAMAFEEAESQEDEQLDDAPMKVLGETISCHFKPGHGIESVEQAFWRSCNPIFAQLALRLGVDRFYSYIHAFGLLDLTHIDLPAESTGLIHSSPTELDMATFSYGESATITPLQMITAFAVFANGGNLVRPAIVKTVSDFEGNIIRDIQPETVRKVVSETTSARIRELLKGVVLYGTGTGAYIEGYSVGGKTSTATYVEGISVTGQPTTEDEDHYTLSFASLAPVENPEIVTLVVLYKPEDQKLSSGVAAAVNGQIVSRTLEYLGISREYSDSDVSRLSEQSEVPDTIGLTYAQATRELSEQGFRAQAGDSAMGEATVVKYQWPEAGTQMHQKSLIFLYPVDEPEEELMVIPDFTGKNVHECIRSAADIGLNIRIVGDSLGLAVSQDPLPTFSEPDLQVRPQPVEDETIDDNADSEDVDSDQEDVNIPEQDESPDEAEERVTHLKRGSFVSIRFAAVEEFTGDYDDLNPEAEEDQDSENGTGEAAGAGDE